MNRFRIGVILLLTLLILGLAAQKAMQTIQLPIAGDLERAAECAAAGDWSKAKVLAARAEQNWQAHWRLTAAAADHQPMEDIDSLMAQLRIYGDAESDPDFPALCAELARRIRAMSDAHRLSFANLL